MLFTLHSYKFRLFGCTCITAARTGRAVVTAYAVHHHHLGHKGVNSLSIAAQLFFDAKSFALTGASHTWDFAYHPGIALD
jgi:hypothetical protein